MVTTKRLWFIEFYFVEGKDYKMFKYENGEVVPKDLYFPGEHSVCPTSLAHFYKHYFKIFTMKVFLGIR